MCVLRRMPASESARHHFLICVTNAFGIVSTTSEAKNDLATNALEANTCRAVATIGFMDSHSRHWQKTRRLETSQSPVSRAL